MGVKWCKDKNVDCGYLFLNKNEMNINFSPNYEIGNESIISDGMYYVETIANNEQNCE